MQEKIKRKFGDLDDLKTDNYRRQIGLTEIQRGERLCMNCNQKFLSFDLRSNRMCDACRSRLKDD